MRKLLGLTVVLAVLGVCAPSYGYILVYKVAGAMKAQEWGSDTLTNVSVKGYLAMDIDDSDEVVDAKMVLYGKGTGGNLVYSVDDFNDSDPNIDDNIYWGNSGRVVELDVWNINHIYPFSHEFMMTGILKSIDVGLGATEKKMAASSLKGSLVAWRGPLLDSDQDLFGSGAATMTLDTKQTKAANAGSKTVDDIITTFIAGLKGYSEIIL